MFEQLKDDESEIEMTGGQVKHEALGTNSFKMAEIEADDQWSFRSTMQRAQIWLPDIVDELSRDLEDISPTKTGVIEFATVAVRSVASACQLNRS